MFTESSISLSQYWRQWESRYTIHARRNLPDKEFRYLRTVIVTAAVYWDLKWKQKNNTFLDLPAPGRCQTLYIIFSILQSLVFLINSRHPLFSDTHSTLVLTNVLWYLFSRSYEVILPSSFNIVLSHLSILY